ncbi:4-oxalocrotonate tautomerase [Streptomyces sp. 3213]|uniref:tautomerase family protein n=1 Tax=Streptomyces sp. 3213.3 TaxID=1855348 RepID=UPI00089B15CC|nr:tautomerase family protein [Streptomyces sp. 3213.3]SEE16442.1 4-oxalocrotonate tautomerase [Streptomyces sp. 3213] [Streptomyces sp. 3213.3]
MPHISIKHFPRTFTEAEKADLVAALTETVTRVFGTDAGAVSLAVEPVEPVVWMERVHGPEIEAKPQLLWKQPNYSQPLPTETTEGTR